MGFIENLEKELFEMQDLKYRFSQQVASGNRQRNDHRDPHTDASKIHKRVCKDSGGRSFYAGTAA